MTLPKSCEVEALRVWINALADCDLPESACRSCLATARAVRALLADVARKAAEATDAEWRKDADATEWHPIRLPLIRDVVTRVVGPEVAP